MKGAGLAERDTGPGTLACERLTFDQFFGLVPSIVQLWNDCLRNMGGGGGGARTVIETLACERLTFDQFLIGLVPYLVQLWNKNTNVSEI